MFNLPKCVPVCVLDLHTKHNNSFVLCNCGGCERKGVLCTRSFEISDDANISPEKNELGMVDA